MAGPRGELVANVVENNTVTDVEVVVGVVRHITQVGNIGTSAALLKFSDGSPDRVNTRAGVVRAINTVVGRALRVNSTWAWAKT